MSKMQKNYIKFFLCTPQYTPLFILKKINFSVIYCRSFIVFSRSSNSVCV
nr:MAG TPA: hypothetical protein [Caudoviricetes sp.]